MSAHNPAGHENRSDRARARASRGRYRRLGRGAIVALALILQACSSGPPECVGCLTPADRAKLREWAPAFTVLCAAEQLGGCRDR